MRIRVEQGKGRKDRYVMLSRASAGVAARLVEGGAAAGLAVPSPRSGAADHVTRQLNRACHAAARGGRDRQARLAAHAAALLRHAPVGANTTSA